MLVYVVLYVILKKEHLQYSGRLIDRAKFFPPPFVTSPFIMRSSIDFRRRPTMPVYDHYEPKKIPETETESANGDQRALPLDKTAERNNIL